MRFVVKRYRGPNVGTTPRRNSTYSELESIVSPNGPMRRKSVGEKHSATASKSRALYRSRKSSTAGIPPSFSSLAASRGRSYTPPMDVSKYQHTEKISVAADPDTLYDMVSDVTRMGEWSPVCNACEWTDDAHEWFIGT